MESGTFEFCLLLFLLSTLSQFTSLLSFRSQIAVPKVKMTREITLVKNMQVWRLSSIPFIHQTIYVYVSRVPPIL